LQTRSLGLISRQSVSYQASSTKLATYTSGTSGRATWTRTTRIKIKPILTNGADLLVSLTALDAISNVINLRAGLALTIQQEKVQTLAAISTSASSVATQTSHASTIAERGRSEAG
jgi:hypothetical protein